MAKLIDLHKAISEVLEFEFHPIEVYSEETKEGFKRPAFFTQVIPVSTEYETTNYESNIKMVVINYFSKNGTELENLQMYDEIKKAFGMTLKVNNRSFLLKNIRSEIVDSVLQFRFDLDYLVDVEKINDREIMEYLQTEIIRSDK